MLFLDPLVVSLLSVTMAEAPAPAGGSSVASRDSIRTIGAQVHAKAIHVTSEAECARRYGSRKKTKLVSGVVEKAEARSNNPDGSGRRQWWITARFDLGGGTLKTVELNSRSVHAGCAPLPPDELLAQHQQHQQQQQQQQQQEQQQQQQQQEEEANQEEAEAQQQDEAVTATVGEPPPVQEEPAQVAHGTPWFEEKGRARHCINGIKPYKEWSITTAVGETISASDVERASRYSRLDYFLMLFPGDQLLHTVRLTNEKLAKKNAEPTTRQEILKFFGLSILVARFEFCNRRDLWRTVAPSKYEPAMNFGLSGMSRNRYDILYTTISFSQQPEVRPENMRHEQWRWMLVDDFVDAFNRHREEFFTPSDRICVDESFSRWYGLGGFWINKGLPQYVSMDRKPEAGCELQDACCARSGVMLCLKLVKSAQEEASGEQEEEDGLNHGTKVLKSLVQPWAFSGRVVVGDSYFASLNAADEMARLGFGFIGVVKTATRHFPQQHLSTIELQNRGDYKGVITMDTNGSPNQLAFVWMDRDRRYFIANTSSIAAGTPWTRERWRQDDPVDTNEEPTHQELTIPIPKAAEEYYDACGMIDRHNRSRQDNLQLERKLGTKEWHRRVNFTILGMIVVDTWLVWKGIHGEAAETEKDFYRAMAEELIDNDYDAPTTRRRRSTVGHPSPPAAAYGQDGQPRSGLGVHLTPTKRKRKGSSTHLLQGHCSICQKKTTCVCASCREESPDGKREVWLCDSRHGRTCFAEHVSAKHS